MRLKHKNTALDLSDEEVSSDTFKNANFKDADIKNKALCHLIDMEVAEGNREKAYDQIPGLHLLKELVTHAPKLENFDSNLNPRVKAAFQMLRESGLYSFVKECVKNDGSILISIAQFAAEDHLPPEDRKKPVSIEELDLIRCDNPTLHAFLNHMAISAAKEIGLLSPDEAAVLGAQTYLDKQDAQLTCLNVFLLRSHDAIEGLFKLPPEDQKAALKHFDVPGDAESLMCALLSSNSVRKFPKRLEILEGYVSLGEVGTELTKKIEEAKDKSKNLKDSDNH